MFGADLRVMLCPAAAITPRPSYQTKGSHSRDFFFYFPANISRLHGRDLLLIYWQSILNSPWQVTRKPQNSALCKISIYYYGHKLKKMACKKHQGLNHSNEYELDKMRRITRIFLGCLPYKHNSDAKRTQVSNILEGTAPSIKEDRSEKKKKKGFSIMHLSRAVSPGGRQSCDLRQAHLRHSFPGREGLG